VFNNICVKNIRGSTKVMLPIFFSENVIVVTVKFTWMIHTHFAIMRLFFCTVFITFNAVLPTLSKMLYTSVVKFPALTSENIMSGTRKLQTYCNNAFIEFVLTDT
jgi:hypothetical protein